jgi:transglutaminase-like putative cysteine protease
VSVDVTNSIFASDSHCRLAIGRDYLDACPIRGMREGGLIEKLDVSVTVQTLQQ